MSIINVQQITQTQAGIVGTTNGTPVTLKGCERYSAQIVADVNTPSPQTFDSGVAASLIVQDLTYLADLRGTAGNLITIAYTAGGTAGAEVVTVVGSAISVSIDVTAITGSSATQVKAAVDASVPASALISVSITGSGATVQAAAAATPLAGGVASEVDTSTELVSIPAHGFVTGVKVRLTTTGTLPAGVTTGVDYFTIAASASTLGFASSLLNAQAGTLINLTDQGSSAAVNTVTATSIAGGSVKLQESNDDVNPTNWNDRGTATNITVDANIILENTAVTANWMRLVYTLTAGAVTAVSTIVTKGPA